MYSRIFIRGPDVHGRQGQLDAHPGTLRADRAPLRPASRAGGRRGTQGKGIKGEPSTPDDPAQGQPASSHLPSPLRVINSHHTNEIDGQKTLAE
jgi:hypothetical protein